MTTASEICLVRKLSWTCTQQQITLLPTSSEGLSIPPVLLFAKDQTQAEKVMVTATEKEIKAVKGGGVNNGGSMDRGPMMFTSDVSLPKDDKIAKLGEQITAGQLTEL